MKRMGLFGRIKDNYRKSEAAVIVQNLLEMQSRGGMFDADPASSATVLVQDVWLETPHIFDGRFGQRPHKLSVAAAAFAHAIQGEDTTERFGYAYMLSLGNILNEISVNGRLYPLNSIDEAILEKATETFVYVSEQLAEGSDIDTLLDPLKHERR